MHSGVRRLTAALFALAVLPAWAAAQGTITGKVTDRSTQQPVPNAQVLIVGTTRGIQTDDQGQFRLAGVDAGTVQLRALRVGYAAASKTVTVVTGQTVTADFALEPSATTIDVVTVTATGQSQRKRETGAAIGTVDVDSLDKAKVTNFSDVLQSRVPGVTVQSAGGTTGSGSRVRIRGSNSVSLSNEPLLYVDGIRVDNNPSSTQEGVGGQSPSRLNDINPADIESIEVIKGPAAAALYGTAASNGVIQITTKRGRPGAPTWTAFAEAGGVRDYNHYPPNFRQIGVLLDTLGNPTTTRTTNCNIVRRTTGQCQIKPDSLAVFSPLNADWPFVNGWRQNYGLSVAGGSDVTTYFVSGGFEREQGIYDPNNLKRINLRANMHSQVRDNLDVTVSTGYLDSHLALPQNDNNSVGILPGTLLGSAFDNSRHGWFFVTPDKLFALDTRQHVNRFTGSVASNYQPISWLSFHGTAGLDFEDREDSFLILPGIFTPGEDTDLNAGQRATDPFKFYTYTANLSSTARFALPRNMQSSTTVGLGYSEEQTHGTNAFGEGLTPGTSSLNGTTSLFNVDETNRAVITLGYLAQEELSWRDRLFLSGAVRTDRNSAFGTNFGRVYYPSANLSWVVSDEPFFPQTDILSSLRLRTAYGESGNNPSFRDAITFFSPVSVAFEGADVPGLVVGGTGNTELKPERSREYEAGFDVGLFRDRANAEVTYFHKTTFDALVAQDLAPSIGLTTSRFINIGQVRNTGWEFQVSGTPLDTRYARLDLTVNGTTTHNKVIDLGEGIAPIIFGLGGDTQRHQNGFPLGAYFQRPIESFADANGDGLISPDEVVVGDSAVFLGSPFPTREWSISPAITIMKYFRVSGLLDYRGGFKLFNGTEDFRCANFQICQAIQDGNSPLKEQARAVADAEFATVAGYIEDATFWKLRELAVTLSAPTSWANRLNTRGVSLTLAGRNLHTWTDYTGLDPEINGGGQSNFNTFDFLSQPPVRYYTARINVTF